jgi:hypothetical protein
VNTPTPTRSQSPHDAEARPLTTVRRAAFVIAVLACLPYLALKITWIAGGELGIPSGSSLLDPDNAGTMRAANGLTVLMDSAVIALALALTTPWGRRVPAWLLAGPTWVATGLLAPIVIGFPLQLVVAALTDSAASGDAEPFLEAWVFSVVYGGFMVQAFALGTLFVTYAVERWGALWRGRVSDLTPTPTLPALRVAAVAAAVVSLVPLTMQVLWASGSVLALPEGMADNRGVDQLLAHVPHVLTTLAATAGVLIVAFRLGPRLPLTVPFLLVWVGSSAMACWGAWSLFATLAMASGGDQATPGLSAVHALHVVVGVVVAVAGMHFVAERSADRVTSAR